MTKIRKINEPAKFSVKYFIKNFENSFIYISFAYKIRTR